MKTFELKTEFRGKDGSLDPPTPRSTTLMGKTQDEALRKYEWETGEHFVSVTQVEKILEFDTMGELVDWARNSAKYPYPGIVCMGVVWDMEERIPGIFWLVSRKVQPYTPENMPIPRNAKRGHFQIPLTDF